jgi:hypothetical protein
VAVSFFYHDIDFFDDSKIHRGFDNFAKNTGERHPSAPPQRKRAVGHDALTDDNNQLWQGMCISCRY